MKNKSLKTTLKLKDNSETKQHKVRGTNLLYPSLGARPQCDMWAHLALCSSTSIASSV